MAQTGAVKGGRYLYAVVSGSETRTFSFTGLNDQPVYTLAHQEVAAVVSDLANGQIRPERRHLAAQQAVLKGLMQESLAVLPMAFGIIADGPKAIQKILARNQGALLRQLQRVAGKVEMGLRVSWDVPNIFEYFVNSHQELRLARDRLVGPSRYPSQEDKIQLGRLFDRCLQEDRETFTDQVAETLAPCCLEIKRNRCRQEHEVMNLVCLVGRDSQCQEQFEEGIFTAARLFDNHYAFDYNGPWAPHNFVDLDLKI